MKVGIFPHMQLALGIGLNKCVALRKPFISEANWGEKRVHLLGSKKMGPCSNEKGHVVRGVQIYSVPE